MKRVKRHDVGAHGMRPGSVNVPTVGAQHAAPLRNANEQSQGLPEGWVWTTVGQLFDIVGGGTPSTSVTDYWSGSIPWITSADIFSLKDIRPRKHISQEALQNSTTNLVPSGSLIVVTRVGLGKVALTKDPVCFSQDCQGLVANNSSFSNEYALYYLSQAVQIFKYEHRGTTIPGVTKKQLSNLPFPFAPFSIQKLIVAEIEKQFSRLDEAVAALRRGQANLKRYKASVLKAAVDGRLTEEWRRNHCRGAACCAPTETSECESGADLLKRILAERRRKWEEDYVKKYVGAHGHAPKDDSWKKKYKEPAAPDISNLPELPQGWMWAASEEACSSVRDGTHDTPKYVKDGIPLITSKNLLPSGLDFENINYISNEDHMEISKRSAVEEGDVLFAMIGTVGNPVVVKTRKQFSIKNVGLFKKNTDYLLPEYLRLWLASPIFEAWLKPRLKGTTQKFAPLGLLRSLVVPLPPLSEQNAIVEEVDRRLSVAEEIDVVIETNLKRAERMRQAILKKAFEGRLIGRESEEDQ